jgi:ribosome maturation factor RimP
MHPGDDLNAEPDEGVLPETGKGAAAVARVREAIVALAEPIVAASLCELVNLEWRREPQGWVLRLYVERLGHDPRLSAGGVTLAECVRISRDLGVALDVAEVPDHAFHLEVSSPGLDRPLVKPADYTRFAGLRAKVTLRDPDPRWPGRRNFRGELLAGTGTETVAFREDDLGEITLPFETIAKAHLVYQPQAKPKPGKHRHESKAAPKAAASAQAAPQATASGQAAPRRRPR